jgi:vacuolar-type H+-ATPase subunit I/STV1
MNLQDNRFNFKIILAALVAVIVGILIAFYYSYAQSRTEISFLEQERNLLVRDLTLMRAEVDRLSALNEVNEIELEDSRRRVDELLDSVGRLTYDIKRLREFRTELRKLEARYDSIKLRNNYLEYTNMQWADKYAETEKLLEQLRSESNSLAAAEAALREKNRELNRELRRKSYLKLENPDGSGFRLRNQRPIRTNKASTIEKLRGCVTVMGNPNTDSEEKVLYLQFLGPDMRVIEDQAQIVSVHGNIYSKRIELLFTGQELEVCDFITVPEGSLTPGIYTLNVFEDERLLSTAEFQLR